MGILCQAAPGDTMDPAMRVFVVLESNPLIAADLIGTLEAAFACRVIHASSPAHIPEALGDIRAVSAAFLEMRAEDVTDSGLGRFLRARGAQLVLTRGDPAIGDAQPRDVTLLARPFTDTMVLDALKSAPNPGGPSATR